MKHYIAILLLFVLSWAGSARLSCTYANEAIRFSHISIDEGLSQSTVFSITQDRKGCMWFATYDGVNRYDGYSFTVYQHRAGDTTSIASDITRILKTDSKGRIWVGTRKGLSFYNEAKDIFENYYFKNKQNAFVTDIVELSDEKLWVCVDGKLRVFDIPTKTFSTEGLNKDLRRLDVSSIYRVDNNVYIGDVLGKLYVYTIDKAELREVDAYKGSKGIQAILQDFSNNLWIGTEGDGLYLLNPQTGSMEHYLHSSKQGSISSNYIRSLALDSNGKLWVGTFNDLNIYNESSDTFTTYTSNIVDPESLSHRSVRCIFKDAQGGMWLGTFFGGLNYYHPLKNRFKNIQRIPYQNSLNDNVVSCIVEDSNHDLWIGTNDGGVNFYDLKSGKFKSFLFNEHQEFANGLESNNVKAIYIDEKQNRVYVGTHAGGLKVIHRNTGQIEHCTSDDPLYASRNIYAILPQNERYLWVGTLNGLYLFDKNNETFSAVSRDIHGNLIAGQSINVLYRDGSDRLWIGGENSLQLFQITAEGLEKLSLPLRECGRLNTIQCIYESSGHDIWFATRMGLYCFNEGKKSLTHYTVKDGLPNNVVYGIEEDSYGFIWVSTNHGLSCFNPNIHKFRNFTVNDGLTSNQFNTYSYCRGSDGTMYFGGIGGITTFRPELLVDNPYSPQVFITRLSLYNKEVRPDDETGILSENISMTKHITLAASQKAFTLDFVVSNYISGEHNTFAYQLEGYDKQWYYLTNSRSVSYSNLPHGKYRFCVKAANSDGKWNTEPTVLEITVLPFWYQTWWARILFVLLVIGLLAFTFRYFWVRKTMEARLKMEHQEKLHQEEISQMKMRFFINMSHELRTPLTLILAPVQEMLARCSERWMRDQLKYVERNANRLLHLVNQLMDYRRAELGVFKLSVASEDAFQVVKENFSYYEKLARHKGIEYTLVSDLEGKKVLVDVKYLELIVNNLLSNAFKYTESGNITVKLSEEEGYLLLQISDTGIGIPLDRQKRIFERFYQLDDSHMGSGIGLSLVQRLVELHHGKIRLDSSEGKGSCFSIYFPQDRSAYSEEEFYTPSGEKEVTLHSTNSKEMYFFDTEKPDYESADSNGGKRGTLLLVEDNDEIRSYLNSGLSSLFTVLQASNGQEAVDLLKDSEVDIIITDVMMPVMDGIKLCKYVKQNICTSHIPVIMLSAKTDIAAQMEGLQIGADDYIAKPFPLSLLISKIQNMMRTRMRILEKYSKTMEIEPEKIAFNAMDEELLKRAIEIVEKNMDNTEFSTEDFAKAMNMSRSNLHLKLKAITGESAIEFIRKIRFKEACLLLKEGRYNIAEISTKVGFNTPSYFATSFKKYVGCLPTEYVKRPKKGEG